MATLRIASAQTPPDIPTTQKEDTSTVKSLIEKANSYYLSNPDTAILFCEQALLIAQQLNYREGISECYGWLGYLFTNKGDIVLALEYLKKELVIKQALNNKKGKAICLNNIAIIYKNQGDIASAIQYFHQTLQTMEELGERKNVAIALNNLGIIHDGQGDTRLALDYYKKSLKIREEIDDAKGIAISLNNIGTIYRDLGQYDEALVYTQKAMGIAQKMEDLDGESSFLANIGVLMAMKKDTTKAIDYLLQSLAISRKIEDKDAIAKSLIKLGSIQLALGKVEAAKKSGKEALTLSFETNFPESIRDAAKLMNSIANRERDYQSAFEMYRLHIQMRDSIINEKTQKATITQQMKYEFDKKESLLQAEKDKQELANKEKVKRQRLAIWSVGAGLALVIIFSIFLFSRYRVTQQQKKVITAQKEIVDEKNRNITDSIKYAQKIQEAILPSNEDLHRTFGSNSSGDNYFVLFRPKDVVSGDFYWLHETTDNKVIWATADCTGHGVPGAFMSMIGSSLLNEIVIEKGITKSGEILNQLRDSIKKDLGHAAGTDERTKALPSSTEVSAGKPSETGVKDGMDIALCVWDRKTNELQFSGAYNPLYLIRNGELFETKANRQPIGIYLEEIPFDTIEVPIEQGDSLYLFSDGFMDQFGGPNNKKYTAKRFRESLLSVQNSPMNDQLIMLNDIFEKWRGGLEQLDDICIFGVRV